MSLSSILRKRRNEEQRHQEHRQMGALFETRIEVREDDPVNPVAGRIWLIVESTALTVPVAGATAEALAPVVVAST